MCVPSLSTTFPFCLSVPSCSIFPLHSSSHFPFSSFSFSWDANTIVPRASSGRLPLGSSARRTLYLHHQIYLGLPRDARAQTAASGLAGGLRQIGHRVTRIRSGCLAGWLVGQHPPFRHHWLNTAAWRRRACHRTLRFLSVNVRRRHSACSLSQARNIISPEIARQASLGDPEKYANKREISHRVTKE